MLVKLADLESSSPYTFDTAFSDRLHHGSWSVRNCDALARNEASPGEHKRWRSVEKGGERMQAVRQGPNTANHMHRHRPGRRLASFPVNFRQSSSKPAAYQACNFQLFFVAAALPFLQARLNFVPSVAPVFSSPSLLRIVSASRCASGPAPALSVSGLSRRSLQHTMRTAEVIYPSFTSAMITLEPSLRLPAYRSSYSVRFHPYPRGGPRRSEYVFVVCYLLC